MYNFQHLPGSDISYTSGRMNLVLSVLVLFLILAVIVDLLVICGLRDNICGSNNPLPHRCFQILFRNIYRYVYKVILMFSAPLSPLFPSTLTDSLLITLPHFLQIQTKPKPNGKGSISFLQYGQVTLLSVISINPLGQY
jgi:hypothetical protein